jgi:DNA-binding NarL/FixJ family response regulator
MRNALERGTRAVHAFAAQYGITIPPDVARQLARTVLTAGQVPPQLRSAATAASRRIPPRRLEVLPLVAQGLENDDIAAVLTVTPSTAKRHVHWLYGDLSARNRAHAAAIGVALGLVDPLLVVPAGLGRAA